MKRKWVFLKAKSDSLVLKAIDHAFQVFNTNLKAEGPTNNKATKSSCSKSLVEHPEVGNTALMFIGSRLFASENVELCIKISVNTKQLNISFFFNDLN